MKQEKNNKSRKWLLPVIIAVAVLAIVGVVIALLGGSGGTGEQSGSGTKIHSKLYWNVGREQYVDPETNLSVRKPGADGLYHILFAVDGEQVELTAADKKLVNRIDAEDVLGLNLDDDGMIIDIYLINQIATETAKDVFVQRIDGNSVTLNSSMALNGMEIPVTVSADTAIYDVSDEAEMVGQVAELGVLDKVQAYSDDEGNLTHIYITERAEESNVYWRVARKYSSTTKKTTRKPDENGVYSIEFVVDSQQVTLKCKDEAIVNAIDAVGAWAGAFGLLFDEEGYIVDTLDVVVALKGAKRYASWNVIELEGDQFTLERQISGNDQGKTFTGTLAEDTKIYNVSTVAEVIGEPTQLQKGDCVLAYSDQDGKPLLIYVVNRLVDSPMYYNLERNYTKGETGRKPDASGYYVFKLAVDGKVKEFKTKDKAIASKLDSFPYKCVGLKVNGNIIENVYSASCVTGYYEVAANMYVTGITGPILSAANADDTKQYNGVLSADCKIYNVTGVGVEVGAADSVKEGDQIVAYTNPKGEILYLYIINRMVDVPVYWNYSRQYDSKLEMTKRVPDENGYYVFRVAVNGKDTTVKTKSKALATKMDACNPQFFALKVSGGIVKEVYPAIAATGGAIRSSWFAVESISKEQIVTYSLAGSGTTKLTPAAEGIKVYNVSNAWQNNWGEKTTLKVGDQIHALTNREGKTVMIFVRSREIDSPLYWNKSRKYNTTTGETTRKPDADGWYVFDLAVNGEIKQFKTKDKEVASQVDSYRIAFTLMTNGNVIERVLSASAAKNIKGSTASWLDVMSIKGDKIYVQQNIPDAADLGEGYELTLAKNYKVYDACGYVNTFGSAVSLGVGDRIHAFTNDDGQVAVIYIVRDNTRKGGAFGYCEHCKQEVLWMPWSGEAFEPGSGHYHLTHNITNSLQRQVGMEPDAEGKYDTYDIVIDLNGNTLTASSRAFRVCYESQLSICDSVGGGKIQAKGTSGNGGAILMQRGGKLNLYGGTITRVPDSKKVTAGGVIHMSAAATTVNMYGGTITGGTAPLGGNICIGGGVFNMYGGTITGGETTAIGGNIMVDKSGTFHMLGGTVSDGTAVRGGNIGGYNAMNVLGGTVTGGTATYGGNIFVYDNAVAAVSGSARIENGTAQLGGNIYLSEVSGDTSGKVPTLTVSGGTVTGGKLTGTGSSGNIYTYRAAKVTFAGGTVDGDVLLNSGTDVTLSGKTVINKGTTSGLNLSGVKAKVENLAEGAYISVSTGGTFTQAFADAQAAENAAKYFQAYDPDMKIFAEGNVLVNGIYTYCDHCDNRVLWSTFTGGTFPTANGHYYLSKNVSFTGPTTVEGTVDNKLDIVLDLHGHTLTADRRIRLKYTEVSVIDSVGGGVWQSPGSANGYGGVVMVTTGSTLNLHSGTLTQTEKPNNYGRGVVYIAAGNATFNMYGGTVIGGEAGSISDDATAGVANGGSIYMDYGTFNMTGGLVTGGTAATYGDNIYARNTSKLTFGGTAKVDGGVWVESTTSVTLSGTPVIAKADSAYGLHLPAGMKLTVNDLAEGASINVTGSGVIATAADEATAQTWADEYFVSDVLTNEMAASGTDLVMQTVASVSRCPLGHLTHEGQTKDCPHAIVEWTPWTASDSLPLSTAGNYFLTGPVSIAPNQKFTANVMLDLNGYDITSVIPAGFTGTRRGLSVGAGVSLGITDLSGNNVPGAVKLNLDKSFQTAASGSVCYVSGELILYNGILDGSSVYTNTTGGAAICVDSNKTFTMYGGTVKGVGGAKNTNGSTIAAFEKANVNIHGGQLIGTRAANGANIYSNGNLTITGGTFTPGKLVDSNTGSGANIYINHADAVVNISGDANILGGLRINKAKSVTLSGKAKFQAGEGTGYDLKFSAGIPVLDGEGKPMLTSKAVAYTAVYNADGELLGLCPVTDSTAAEKLQVGYGREVISPEDAVPLAGYGNTSQRISESILDDIYATCIAMTDESGNTVLLFTQDMINSSLHATARQKISAATAVPEENIFIAATHTHSTPDVSSSNAAIAEYKTLYYNGMVKAAMAALADRAEAQMYTGAVDTDGMNFIRHYTMKDGSVAGSNFGDWSSGIAGHAAENDPAIQVVKFDRAEEDVILMNFQAHPCFSADDGNGKVISADFIGAVRTNVEQATGAKFAYFTGAAGNQNPDSLIKAEKHDMTMAQYGKKLADYVTGAELTKMATTTIKTTTQTYVGTINHEMEDKLDQAREVVDVWHNGAGKQAARELAKSYGFSSEYHCNAVIRRVNLGKTQDLGLSTISVGDLSFVIAPYEMFAKHGLYMKGNSPYDMTFIVSCANGSNGYLASTEAYDYGCYESHTSNFARGTAEAVADTFLKMLLALKNA